MATGWSLGAAQYVHLIEALFATVVALGYVASRSRGRAHTLRGAVSVATNAPGAEEPPASRRLWYWEMANWLLIIPGAYLIIRVPLLAVVDILALALFCSVIRRRRKEWAGELERSWLILPLLSAGVLLMAVARFVLQALGN